MEFKSVTSGPILNIKPGMSFLASCIDPMGKVSLPDHGYGTIPDGNATRGVKKSLLISAELTNLTEVGFLFRPGSLTAPIIECRRVLHPTIGTPTVGYRNVVNYSEPLAASYDFARLVSAAVELYSSTLPAGVFALSGQFAACPLSAPLQRDLDLYNLAALNTRESLASVSVSDGIVLLHLPDRPVEFEPTRDDTRSTYLKTTLYYTPGANPASFSLLPNLQQAPGVTGFVGTFDVPRPLQGPITVDYSYAALGTTPAGFTITTRFQYIDFANNFVDEAIIPTSPAVGKLRYVPLRPIARIQQAATIAIQVVALASAVASVVISSDEEETDIYGSIAYLRGFNVAANLTVSGRALFEAVPNQILSQQMIPGPLGDASPFEFDVVQSIVCKIPRVFPRSNYIPTVRRWLSITPGESVGEASTFGDWWRSAWPVIRALPFREPVSGISNLILPGSGNVVSEAMKAIGFAKTDLADVGYASTPGGDIQRGRKKPHVAILRPRQPQSVQPDTPHPASSRRHFPIGRVHRGLGIRMSDVPLSGCSLADVGYAMQQEGVSSTSAVMASSSSSSVSSSVIASLPPSSGIETKAAMSGVEHPPSIKMTPTQFSQSMFIKKAINTAWFPIVFTNKVTGMEDSGLALVVLSREPFGDTKYATLGNPTSRNQFSTVSFTPETLTGTVFNGFMGLLGNLMDARFKGAYLHVFPGPVTLIADQSWHAAVMACVLMINPYLILSGTVAGDGVIGPVSNIARKAKAIGSEYIFLCNDDTANPVPPVNLVTQAAPLLDKGFYKILSLVDLMSFCSINNFFRRMGGNITSPKQQVGPMATSGEVVSGPMQSRMYGSEFIKAYLDLPEMVVPKGPDKTSVVSTNAATVSLVNLVRSGAATTKVMSALRGPVLLRGNFELNGTKFDPPDIIGAVLAWRESHEGVISEGSSSQKMMYGRILREIWPRITAPASQLTPEIIDQISNDWAQAVTDFDTLVAREEAVGGGTGKSKSQKAKARIKARKEMGSVPEELSRFLAYEPPS